MRLKIFLVAFLLSLPFWWGVNVFQIELENFLFWKGMADNPRLLMAQVVQEENLAKLKPIRNRQVKNLEIEAEAAISVLIDSQGSERILFEKKSDEILPIASLTKLMTANIVLEYYDVSQTEIGELLFPLLIASDNNAAANLAKFIGEKAFVDLMNFEAESLGLKNTYFVNPSGLDPQNPSDPVNHSTAREMVEFAKYLTAERPLIWEISLIPEYKNAANTNELLKEIPDIIGGKTGKTTRAGRNLLLLVKTSKNQSCLINVILNSKDHFEEMKKLMNWVQHAYRW